MSDKIKISFLFTLNSYDYPFLKGKVQILIDFVGYSGMRFYFIAIMP